MGTERLSLQVQFAPDGTCYSLCGPPPQGAGPVLVLLHGLGLDQHMWASMVPGLASSHTVVAFDALGHGASARAAQGLSLERLVGQVTALLDHLGIGSAVLVGYDLGGQVAMAMAAREAERVAGLVLISTAFRRLKAQRDALLRRIEQARRRGPAATADSAIQRWFSAAFQAERREVVAAVRERLASNDPDSYLAAAEVHAGADEQTIEDVRAIRCPLLVMCGALDMGSTPAMARRLADGVPGARLLVVPRQRHMLPLEAPEVVNGAVLGFVARA